jgi:hypothetical protein
MNFIKKYITINPRPINPTPAISVINIGLMIISSKPRNVTKAANPTDKRTKQMYTMKNKVMAPETLSTSCLYSFVGFNAFVSIFEGLGG